MHHRNVLKAPNFVRRYHFLNLKPKLTANQRHYIKYPFSMARTQSRKRRLFLFARASNSASGLASNQSSGRSEGRAGDFSSIPETSGMTPPGRIARMRRFFHRPNQRPSPATATEIIVTLDNGGAQVSPDQGVAAASAGSGGQDQQEQPQTAPAKNVCDLR
ncbi:hypothetical protein EV401DRAFT_1893879 [Pisolithus croceorrhizus]|nr:hypothetical protein EV401DRAFT_1893879 [Pisolithus croceorrhizus]